MHDVWITGAGIVSALGCGLAAHEDAVMQCRSGLAPQRLFDGAPPDPCMCGMVPRESLDFSIEESAACRGTLLLDTSVGQALASAGLGAPVSADICVGTTVGNVHGATRYYGQLKRGKIPGLSSLGSVLPFRPVCTVAGKHGIRGRRWTVSSACGSASAAFGMAFNRIRHGLSSRIVAGGFDALSPYLVAGFSSLRLVSSGHCRPFDRDRDGLNPGEGAAVAVLESADEARNRGAQPLARLAGFGEALEMHSMAAADPAGNGLALAMRRALDSAKMDAGGVDHLHLHGTGSVSNDHSEYMACRAVFGRRLAGVPACSTKSMTGHTAGGAGAINLVFSMLSVRNNTVPATLFHENDDPAFDGLRVHARPRRVEKLDSVLTTTLGFGGEAFAMLITKAGE